jgi:predicted negative regulator of RcsB-dependent stress response
MDEEISIINSETRNEKIKNFFIKNKKKIIIILSIVILIIFSYFIYKDIKNKNKIKLADKYNYSTINFISGDKAKVKKELIEIINQKDKTYSPLALYFLIDNDLVKDKNEINNLFDVLINQTKLEAEIKNLIVYKKALYNSDISSENELIQILNPIINSESIWKSHALYLMAEYFYSKNERQKAKEFFNQILTLSNSNVEIKSESKKRLNRDFGE